MAGLRKEGGGVGKVLRRAVAVREDEVGALLWSFAFFFCLLCSYYVLRPLRDEMGIEGGLENLQWLFTGTFLIMLLAVPLYGLAVARFPRRTLLPVVYHFFVGVLLLFFLLFQVEGMREYVARAFFVWVSVFNLFVASVFWSFMADLYRNEQARRLFGFVAAGGSLGALAGSLLTANLVGHIGTVNLLLVAALFLEAAVFCSRGCSRTAGRFAPLPASPSPAGVSVPGFVQAGSSLAGEVIGGGVFAGFRLVAGSPYLLGICLYILLFTTTSTFLYFEQAHIVKAAFAEPEKRTALFAWMDFSVNGLTIFIQLLLTGRILALLGVALTLAALPALVAVGFAVLGWASAMWVLVLFQVIRRAANYAVVRPVREILYTVVSREARYKAKGVIDTVVYRGGDAASGWAFVGLAGLGLTLSAIAYLAVPLALLWMATGLLLGRRQEQLRRTLEREAWPEPAAGTE